MPELFVELLCEEIPARMQRRAADDLRRLVTGALVEAGLTYEGAMASATPRRLVLSVAGLPARSPDRSDERRGPRVDAPQKALAGFVRAAGLASIEEAEIVSDPKKGDFYLARTRVPGRPTIEIAADAIAGAVRRFPWPVSMRWGAASVDPGSLRWVRPLTSIVATFGAENEDPDIVPVDLAGVPVGDVTVGHRIHAPEPIRVRRLSDYKMALEKARVVVDLDRRRDQILHDARDRAFALGLELVEDEGLLEEVAGLVEWPVVLVGRFTEAALDLPDEVIRLTIRENQKCFVTRDPATERLANAFILAANLEASDGGAAIVAGNERVVNARLADARFFWEQDVKILLEEHAKKLAGVTFHEKLGGQAERVERIAALAREVAPAVGADPDMAERAARLAKADLVTQMVGEFPELQGYMGRRYAEAQGEPAAVAAAIEEHYSPVGPSDAVPARPIADAVALADRIDLLSSFWAIGEKPTGSKDPFALRRAALGLIRIVLEKGYRLKLADEYRSAQMRLRGQAFVWFDPPAEDPHDPSDFLAFIADRLKVQLREQGAPYDLVDAVFALSHRDDLVDITNRIAALRDFLATEDGATLMAGYRRAVNIVRAEEKKTGPVAGEPDPAALAEPEEKALADAVAFARSGVADAVAREDYAAAMARLAALRAPVDAFFEAVLVNAEDPALRMNRLRLLKALQEVTLQVADFSQISG